MAINGFSGKPVAVPLEPVLLAEDSFEAAEVFFRVAKKLGLTIIHVSNGREALDRALSEEFCFHIVDLVLPDLDGQSIITELKKKKPEAIILIQTAVDYPPTIIKAMKLGVFDYIIKPLDEELITSSLLKSMEFYHLQKTEQVLRDSSGLKLRNQLEWLNYKETRRMGDETSQEFKSIENLTSSLSQGAGVGSMVTLIDLIQNSWEAQGANYLVGKNLLDMLVENNEYLRSLLDGMHSISAIFQKNFDLEATDTHALTETLPGMVERVVPYINEKKIQFQISPFKGPQKKLKVNYKKLREAIEELVINACKYTPSGGAIDVFEHLQEGYLCISVKNDISQNPYGGIPPEYEKLVLEPFFRLLPQSEALAKIERFGLGLGLTVCEYIARKHGGMLFVHDMKDHTRTPIKNTVLAEILLPVE